MLNVGSFPSQDCQGITRRAFLRAGAALPFAVGLSDWLTAPAQAETPKAKSVLLVWLGGGPSHIDLFDPKPDAPLEYRGPFSAIKTRTPGVRFTELLPRLAARSHKFSLIRTNVNFHGGHREASSIGLTGAAREFAKSEEYPPNFGSIVARHRGDHQLPSFISLARGPIGDGIGPTQGYGGGIWGKGYDPFLISCSEDGKADLPELKMLDGFSPQRLTNRQVLRRELDRVQRVVDSSEFERWSRTYQQAFALLTSRDGHKAFDLSQESEKTRETYGQTSFGQSCLLGRRLVEAGVPYVQVNWSQYVEVFFPGPYDYGWDTHSDNFGLMADWHGPLLDEVFSTLLDDVEQRGLLDSTLVLCMGEFGRTPRINAIGSRDHWHQCYFSVWAGGGVQPGRVVGESDPRAELPATEPITPAMVGTTMLELMGISSQMRAELKVLEGGRVIDELL
jgi:hypothetical protein